MNKQVSGCRDISNGPSSLGSVTQPNRFEILSQLDKNSNKFVQQNAVAIRDNVWWRPEGINTRLCYILV